MPSEPAAYPNRYDRNMAALTPEECALLHEKRVAVVGCGGLGGMVAETLARVGVGNLRLIDGDAFEESNLNRQLMCTEETLGRPKALVAAERLEIANSDVCVDVRVDELTEENACDLLCDMDCVVDCLDNLNARFWTAHACQTLGTPLVYGAIAGWFGQVCTVFPGDLSFATIYGASLDANQRSQHEQLGNLPFTAFATASMQAAEAVKVLLGRPGVIRNRLLMLDLLGGTADDVELR